MMRGLCGWLAPDGKFTPCGYTQHTNTAEKIVSKSEEYQRGKAILRYETDRMLSDGDYLAHIGYIKIGAPDLIHTFGDSYVFFPTPHKVTESIKYLYGKYGMYNLTQQQIDWFSTHMHELTNTQVELIVGCRFVHGIDRINFGI